MKSSLLSNTTKLRILLVSSLGFFIAGYNLYISSVAEPFIKYQYHPSNLALGLMQAAAPIGAAIGAIVIGRFLDKIGRKSIMIFNIFFFIVAAILSGLSWNILTLILFRFLVGLGVGIDYPVVSVYLSEMTSSVTRGRQVGIAMFINCLASPVGVLIAYILFQIHPYPDVWRYMFFVGALLAIISLIARAGLPESFIWKLQEKGKHKREIMSFKTLFSKRFIRITVTVALAWFLMDISYYGIGLFTPEILMALNIAPTSNFLAIGNTVVKSTLFVNSFIALGALISIFVIDKLGRKNLQKWGFFFSFFALLILGLLSVLHQEHHIILLIVCFAAFNLILNLGPGTTTYLLPSELYPTQLRGTGHGFASGMAKLGAFVGTIFLPVLQSEVGIGWTVIIISFTLILGFGVTFMIPEETAGMKLK